MLAKIKTYMLVMPLVMQMAVGGFLFHDHLADQAEPVHAATDDAHHSSCGHSHSRSKDSKNDSDRILGEESPCEHCHLDCLKTVPEIVRVTDSDIEVKPLGVGAILSLGQACLLSSWSAHERVRLAPATGPPRPISHIPAFVLHQRFIL